MASLCLEDGGDKTLGKAKAEWGKESVLTRLVCSTANSTLTPELQEAEVFIMDNKRCDRIYRKKSLMPRIVPLVMGNMICATNYGENLCYVSFRKVPAAPLLLGMTPGLGSSSLGRGLLGLPPCHHPQAVLSPVFLLL